MSTRIHLRSAAVQDTVLILQFIRELADYENLAHEVVCSEDALALALFGEHPWAEVVIAELDGEPAGFALYFHNFSTFMGKPGIYLEDLYVRPHFRGKGVGQALLSHLARLAEERGCSRVEWAVLDWNQPAIEFYRRLGARPLEDWVTYRVTGDDLHRLAERGC